MESSATNENHRSLRSRVNSVSLDISEVMNVDLGTPTKKTRSGTSNDTPKETNSRRSKRLTRAGSEANTPPARVTRNTRASSMEPESSTGTKHIEERLQSESTGTLPKTNRRISMAPSEATVIEEKEEFRKIAVVTLDRTLPDLTEVNDLGLENMSPANKKYESLSVTKDIHNASRNSLCDTIAEEKNEDDHNHDDNSTKKLHHKPPENLISNSSKGKGIADDEVVLNDDKNDVNSDETLSADITKHKEPSIDNESQMCSQSEKQDTSKEPELKDDDSNNLKDKHENNSDKENFTVTTDLKNTEDATSNVSLSNPKSLSESNTNVNELDDRSKSPCIGAKRKPRRSRQLSELSNDAIPAKESTSIVNPVNSTSVECIDFSDKEEDDSERIRIFNTTTDSTPIEISKSPSIIGIANSSMSSGSIEILDCSDFPQDNELHEQLEKIDAKECKKDVSVKSEVPNTGKSINKNEESEKEECKMQIESDKLNASEDGCKETSRVEMQSPSRSNKTEQLETMDAKSNTEHTTVSEHAQCSETKEETNNLSLKTSVEFVEGRENTSKGEAPEKEEKSEEVSAQDNSVTLKEQCTNISESNKNKSDSNQTLSKDHQENMEVDDNDSDANAVNLFQDIPVAEWKEKYATSDKNSVHSLSTERLENESEGECDLVLVDREAWLHAENTKEKESSDYDSDDTVLLKAQKGSVKDQNDEETMMDTSIVERKSKASKSKSSNKSNKRKAMEQKDSKNKKEIKDADAKQDTKNETQDEDESISVNEENKSTATSNQSASKLNVSESHSKSLEVEGNVSFNKSKSSEDVSKKRKSLNKSSQEADNKLKESSNVETEKKRKSLNISNSGENETSKTELSNENVLASFETDDKNESLNKSLKKKVKAQRVDVNITEESTADEKADVEKANKKEVKKDVSVVSNAGLDTNESKKEGDDSDDEKEEQSEKDSAQDDAVALKERRTNISETSKNNSKSEQAISKENKKIMEIDDNYSDENVENQSITLPNFLFGGASSSDDDNDSDKTMDSDIQKEYNLHGKEMGKFSDDDVPGDECRASETESSDPDDNGSDLADFVVDDDEEEEDESDEGENEETENEELDKEEDAEVNQNDDEEEMQEEKEEKEEVVLGGNKKEKQNEDSISKSFQAKKSKQKQISSSFIVEDIEQSLNDSQMTFGKKVQAFNKSMTCSTPKIGLSKQEKVDMKTMKKHDFSDTKETENVAIKEKINLRKLNKINGNESLMHKSLPSEFVEVGTKTNLSRSMSSKVEELNKTTLVSSTETPTTKFLRKEKLNESAPVLKGNKLKKLMKANNNKEQNDQIEQDENANEPNVEVAQDTNDSLKRKLLKVADNILENDRPKKRKKRKQLATVETTNPVLFETDSQENRDSETVGLNKDNVSASDIDNNNEAVKVEKKKKKKKKKTDNADVQMKGITEEKLESRNIDVVKKKKKKVKTVEDVSDLTNNNEETKIIKKKKKVLGTLQNENNLNEQLPKKKQKKQKLLSTKNTSEEDKEALLEKLPKKKKKVLSEDNALQSSEEVSATKISKKKKKSLKNNSDQDENMLVEKVPKKKQKLLENSSGQDENASVKKVHKKKQKSLKNSLDQDENTSTEKVSKKKQKLSLEGAKTEHTKRSELISRSQQSYDATSDSDEAPETVAFSKARDEAMEILKRTTDSIKANKEMKKKKRKDHMEKMHTEREMKIKKQELKSGMETQKTNVTRLPDDVVRNLSDVPFRSQQKNSRKRKFSPETTDPALLLPKSKRMKNVCVEDDYTVPSCAGSTTEFRIVDLQKMKKKKKIPQVGAFRQKMLARNTRQPISAYLMYLEKQKASGKNKFCNKPY
ncbi:unnamed protein product [Xylocopa violacea]|uniref:Protein slender lobes n=1 Tax=Xylocopa violacea TaxID=135666 RepID=A0ABP1N4L5_XYLVO